MVHDPLSPTDSQQVQAGAPAPEPDQKKCPFCAELIRTEAIKCRYCGEFLDDRPHPVTRPRRRWYQSNGTIVIALLSVGPLALPLVWLNPHYRPWTKVVVSVVVLGLTVLCIRWVGHIYQQVMTQIDALQGVL